MFETSNHVCFSQPNQSACKMGLNIAVDRMCNEDLHDDWSIGLGENSSDQTLKHLVPTVLEGYMMPLAM